MTLAVQRLSSLSPVCGCVIETVARSVVRLAASSSSFDRPTDRDVCSFDANPAMGASMNAEKASASPLAVVRPKGFGRCRRRAGAVSALLTTFASWVTDGHGRIPTRGRRQWATERKTRRSPRSASTPSNHCSGVHAQMTVAKLWPAGLCPPWLHLGGLIYSTKFTILLHFWVLPSQCGRHISIGPCRLQWPYVLHMEMGPHSFVLRGMSD